MSAPESEFNTNVPDKEERKKIRRKRIEKRHATDEKDGNDSVDVNQGALKTGLQQVSESLFHLDRRKHGGIQDVTSVRVATDESESRRRVEDERMRHERLTKLQTEALSSAKANAAIELKWADLLEKEIPQELHHDIQLQMAACSAIIASKDKLTNEFLMQLRSKDEEYVRALRQQAEDIETMLTQIRSEFKEMQGEYDKEIDAIEDAYLEERDKLIADHTADIDSLFDSRKNKEVYYKEAKQKREEQYQREIEDLTTKGADQYNKLKIELEMNIQTLKQQLEEIRATYQLNTEKLDYNYRVLTELDVEKNAELSRYKRRLTRLKDQLNHFSAKYSQMNALDAKTNNDLTDDYRRLTQKYKDLQAKFRHFEVADTQKFDEVWGMHEDEAKDLVDKLLKADKVISEQQLGWRWKPPDMLSLANKGGGVASSTTGASVAPSGDASVGGGGSMGGGGVDGGGSVGDGDGTGSVNGGLTDPGSHAGANLQKESTARVSGGRIRTVLKLLSREAGFLGLQPQLQQSLDDVPAGEAELSRAEAMLRALGVKSEEKVAQLIQYFFKDHDHGCNVELETFGEKEVQYDEFGLVIPNEEEPEGEQPDEDLLLQFPNEELDDLREVINPESVMAAIRAFMDDAAEAENTVNLGTTGAPRAVSKGGDESGRKKGNNIQNYWTQLSQIVSDESVTVWNQLEVDLRNYKDILTKRAQSISEVDELAAQNIELKRVLNQYLGDPANEKFCIPPSQTMRVNAKPAKPRGKALMSKTGPV
jgi:dynein regulatry complex protein 1